MANSVNNLDFTATLSKFIEQQGSGVSGLDNNIITPQAAANVMTKLEPQIKQQLDAAIISGYDFFLGKTGKLSIVVSLQGIKTDLRDPLLQAFNQNLPAELRGQSSAQVQAYFDQFYQGLIAEIPAELRFDQSNISPSDMKAVLMVKQDIGYFQLGYKLLFVFMLIVVAGIVLLNFQLRAASRTLSVTLLTYGVFEYGGILLGRYLVPQYLSAPSGVPPALWSWLTVLIDDLFQPLATFSLICLAVGAVLLVVSFVAPKPQTAD